MGERVVDPRIIQVVREFSLAGGAESVAFELHRAWREAGISAAVLASASAEVGPDILALSPRTLGRIPTGGPWRHLGRLAAVPLFTVLASLRLRRIPRDAVVVSHGDTFFGDVVVVHAVNRANLQIKRQDGQWLWVLNPIHLWVALRDRVMIGGLRFRRYVAVSNRVRDELMRYYGVPSERIAVIPNGVNLVRFTPQVTDRDAMRRELGLRENCPLLLFVGHEFERKGLGPVLEALAQLDAETMLVVAGAGEIERYTRRAGALGVADRVLFLGARRDVERLYRMADVFVLPTSYETFSLVCMEAMACGTPVVACAVGGIEDYLEDGVNGWAVPRDGAAIAATLRQILSDPALRQRLRDGAIATAARYAWPAVAARYFELVQQLVREREVVGLPIAGPAPSDGTALPR
jgi:UDP-glucose:(heptosyl)LPS alpha-1,3-glucosyltransferase